MLLGPSALSRLLSKEESKTPFCRSVHSPMNSGVHRFVTPVSTEDTPHMAAKGEERCNTAEYGDAGRNATCSRHQRAKADRNSQRQPQKGARDNGNKSKETSHNERPPGRLGTFTGCRHGQERGNKARGKIRGLVDSSLAHNSGLVRIPRRTPPLMSPRSFPHLFT